MDRADFPERVDVNGKAIEEGIHFGMRGVAAKADPKDLVQSRTAQPHGVEDMGGLGRTGCTRASGRAANAIHVEERNQPFRIGALEQQAGGVG